MTKRRGLDSREEPGESGVVEPNYRVDRVFGPAPRAVPRPTEDAAQAASALLERRRVGTPTSPPLAATEAPEAELSLRRQLSRLQRQLAEAQAELATKEDELAAEIEKRLNSVAAHDAVLQEQKALQDRLDQYAAYEARTSGIEQRLQEATAEADEREQFLEREREARIAAQAKVDELTRAFDETRGLWNAERQMAEQRAAAEAAQLDSQRTTQLAAAEQAHAAATARNNETHEAELAELRAAHERSLSALRGELEPRALEARSLAEERERLNAEITALKNDAVREAAARDEAHARDKAQVAEGFSVQQAAAARAHAAELAKVTGERDAQILSLQQSLRSSEALTRGLEEGTSALRETQLKLQRELTETKERAAQLEASVKSLEDRLAAANTTTEGLVEDKRALKEQLEVSAAEGRRNALDRLRFVAYLEEGLALLGALPPSEIPEPPMIERVDTPDE